MRAAFGKRYVDVDVRWKKDGAIVPNALYWETENGIEKYEIDQVLSGPRSMASSAGGVGKRYQVLIGKSRRNLFLEKDRWFIETMK
ncbi:MAG: hypothetical protein IKE28_08450 [Solobacterium sp.]|nr:hypothetical protein [Solobacterium sp.]